MDILIIVDGAVANVAVAESLDAAQGFFPGAQCIERTPDLSYVGPGWIVSAGGAFSAPQEIAE